MKSPKSNILFVTGTDTGVGKTLVSAALASQLSQRNIRVNVAKPVETGCIQQQDGSLLAIDAERLRVNAGAEQKIEDVVFYQFTTPVAPNVASRLENKEIEVEQLAEKIQRSAKECDLLILEGAGGLLVPLLDTYTFGDLAVELGASAVLVVGSRLGCINHTQLSVEALRSREIPLLGYVLNDLHQASLQVKEHEHLEHAALESNRETLGRILSSSGVRELAYLPFQSEIWAEPSQECSAAARMGLELFSDAIIEHFSLKG